MPSAADTDAEALSLDGHFTQGGIVQGRTLAGAEVHLGEQPVRVSADGLFVIGFGRNAAPAAVVRVLLPDGRTLVRDLTITQRRYPVQRIDGLDESKVTPPPEVFDRIRSEAAMIAEVRQRDSAMLDFAEKFYWPATGTVTGIYGSGRILNGKPRSPHYGVDIARASGTPVVAPVGGVATFVHDMYFSGKTLVIDHGHGISSTFLHLDEILVRVGERVEQGAVVATVGASGRVTGAHLDWRVNWFKRRLDPQLAAGPMR